MEIAKIKVVSTGYPVDTIVFYVKNLKAPTWPFVDQLSVTTLSAKTETRKFLQDNFPTIPVKWV